MRRVKTASGATAVQVVDYRDGARRIVDHVGSGHTEGEVLALTRIAQDRIHAGQEAFDLSGPAGRAVGPVVESVVSRVLWEVLEASYLRLGFDSVGDEAFKQLVLARIVEPTSKVDSLRVISELGIHAMSRSTMTRCLPRINTEDYRSRIATACFAHAQSGGDVSLVLYDVTTLYFEAEKEDDLRKVGYSKERRVDPQVVVGLLVDRTGFPLEIGCFDGGKAETHTMVPIVKAFQDRHDLSDMVVVADAGMMSSVNLKDLDAAGSVSDGLCKG